MSDNGLSELVAIAELLDTAQIPWWVDSGTLLALHRDGTLFDRSRDADFDIGMWSDDESKLITTIPDFERLGYRIGRRRYRGAVVKYWFKAPRGSGRKDIDIKMHRRVGDNAVCPGALVRTPDHPAPLRVLSSAGALGVGFLWRRRFRTSWRMPILGVTFTVTSWVIPRRFVEQAEHQTIAGRRLPAPSPIDEYLTFRYGDWRNPTSDWVTHRDDGGLSLTAPEQW